MRIDELIQQLTEIKGKHGDLQVLTRGYDSCGYDGVAAIHVLFVKKTGNQDAFSPTYDDGGDIKAIYLEAE